MARKLEEIRENISTLIMGQPELVQALGLDPELGFEEQVSSTNILKLLSDIVAGSIYFHEQVFERDKAEMLALLQSKKPHQLQWYRDKALAFQYGPATDPERERELLPDSDEFDNTDIQGTDLDKMIEKERIVKYAAAVEKGGKVFIKVAKGSESEREPLLEKERKALEGYFSQIKDAGVVVEVVSKRADDFKVEMDIYYDPMILDQNGMRLDGLVVDPIRNTIRRFVQNLPFDSVYRNTALVDELQQLPGVVIPELKGAYYRYGGRGWEPINAKVQPDSGYFRVYEGSGENGLILKFIAYDANSELS